MFLSIMINAIITVFREPLKMFHIKCAKHVLILYKSIKIGRNIRYLYGVCTMVLSGFP